MVNGGNNNNEIDSILTDWEGNEIILFKSVLEKHIFISGHADSEQYYQILKNRINNPDNVVESKFRKDTKILNITLENQEHRYLVIVIRYAGFLEKIANKKNLIVTFYGSDRPKTGKELWKQPIK